MWTSYGNRFKFLVKLSIKGFEGFSNKIEIVAIY